MNFLWPANSKTETTALGRIGRVLHWLFTAAAIALIAGGLAVLPSLLNPYSNAGGAALGFAGGAVGVYLFGRALRYIMSNE